jgi:hypothetical protein
MAEKLLDLAGEVGVEVPAKQLIPLIIKHWDSTVPYLRGLAADIRSDPRGGLRRFFQDLKYLR